MHNSTAVTIATEYYLIHCILCFFRRTTTDHLLVVHNAAKSNNLLVVHNTAKSKSPLNKRLIWEQPRQIILCRKKLRADWSQRLLATIRCRIYCLLVCYSEI
jgi:nitrogen fixation protein FixH